MDNIVLTAISLSGVLIAIVLSVVSLVLHYIRRTETPEYTALSAQIRSLDAELVDLMDKVKHWRNRDNVRRAREGAEKKLENEVTPATPADYKAALRSKALASGLGVMNR